MVLWSYRFSYVLLALRGDSVNPQLLRMRRVASRTHASSPGPAPHGPRGSPILVPASLAENDGTALVSAMDPGHRCDRQVALWLLRKDQLLLAARCPHNRASLPVPFTPFCLAKARLVLEVISAQAMAFLINTRRPLQLA
jgi:hypothetical protein